MAVPTSQEDPNEWLDDEDYGLQRLLGLTPVAFSTRHDEHPDTRPCPWWCRARINGTRHLIDPETPLKARHDFGPVAHVALGHYFGEHDLDFGVIRAAVLELKLTALGTNALIKMSRRNGVKRPNGELEATHRPDVLICRPAEAREIAAVLNYLADVVEADGPEA